MNKEKSIKDINKKFGKQLIYYGKDLEGKEVELMSTGILALDRVIGGGLPKGRIVEIHGLQSSSKTSLCLSIIAHYQKQGISCAFIDAEYALNLEYAKNMGVDLEKLIVIQPETGEEAFEVTEELIRSKMAQFIVIDSASALATRSEIEAETGKHQIGNQAKLISFGLRKLIGPTYKNEAIVVFINQLRMNIMGGQYNPYIATGGMALRFYTSLILELKKGLGLERSSQLIGYNIKVKVVKNKIGKPAGECNLQLMFEGGFSAEADLISLGMEADLIRREGNTYYYGETKLGVGENRAKDYLIKNPEVAEDLSAQLQQQLTQ